jgi:hypothetical protein
MDLLYKLNKVDHFEEKYLSAFATSEMVFAIEKVLTISELAYPGLIATLKGICLAKDGSADFRAKNAFIDVIDFQVSELEWPAISNIDLSESVKWAFEVGYGSNTYAESRVGKALAAYTHIVGLRPENFGEVLFRAMKGLEAFYAEGSGNLRYQLSQKVSSWLGKWPASKNIVGTLYDERSKYIHGSAPIEFLSELPESTKEHLKRSDAFVSSSTFASQLLIATLQKCVKERVKNVYWEQTVRKEH